MHMLKKLKRSTVCGTYMIACGILPSTRSSLMRRWVPTLSLFKNIDEASVQYILFWLPRTVPETAFN
jgi:P2-related tail formation protein